MEELFDLCVAQNLTDLLWILDLQKLNFVGRFVYSFLEFNRQLSLSAELNDNSIVNF